MKNRENSDLGKLVHKAFVELGKRRYYSLKEICDVVQSLGAEFQYEEREIEKYLISSPDIKKKNEKYMLDEFPSLVLVGNSPNLIERYNAGAGWNRLLKSMEDICETYLGDTRKISSFPQRMQAVCNIYKMSQSEAIVKGLDEWFNKVKELQASPIHRMLAKMGFTYYLTTNYDFALERALGLRISKTRDINTKEFLELNSNIESASGENEITVKMKNAVGHIHGSIENMESLVMTPKSYVRATHKLMETDPAEDSWLKAFCESEVHICGLNLSTEESLVWYALERRLQYLFENKDLTNSYPRAYVYLFYRETEDKSDYYEKRAVRDLLKTYAVQTILIPVYNEDYISAWKLLIGEMTLIKSGCRLPEEPENDEDDKDEDDGERINEELEKNLRKIEYGHGRLSAKNKNLTTAFVSHYMYPYCCLMSMSDAKCGIVKEAGCWLCYCKVDGERRMYRFSAKHDIQNSISKFEKKAKGSTEKTKDKTKDEFKMNFLLDYRSGKLYEIQENKETPKEICRGDEILDLDQFCRMIYSKKKEEKS